MHIIWCKKVVSVLLHFSLSHFENKKKIGLLILDRSIIIYLFILTFQLACPYSALGLNLLC